MPTIEIYKSDLEKLIGQRIDNLEELIAYVKGEIEEVKDGKLKIELKDTNRPDLWSVEGIARELKGILEIEMGIPKYSILKGNYKVFVDKEVINIRPFIACAVIKNVNLGKEGFESLIQLQEKIMWTYGRRRKKIAIGTHNLDLIKFPVYYKAVKPTEVKFVPLYYDKEMDLNEILEKTETGKKYGYILEGFNEYPILIDSKGEVISFPPIINSNTIGRINEDTRNIFIDVTGTDLISVLITLNILVLALAERGGKIYSVEIIYPDKKIETPVLKEEEKIFNLNKIKKYLGIDLKNEEILNLLKRKRFDVKINDNKLILKYLNYRNDIISEQDVVEEILIAYGFNKIEPRIPNLYTKGGLSKKRIFINKVRELMVGLGATEIYTPVLVNKKINSLFGSPLELLNPVSENYNSIRISLLASFFQLIKENKGIQLPIEFFEVGHTSEGDKLLYVYLDSKVSFNFVKSKLETLFRELNISYDLEKSEYRFLIKGRQGKIMLNKEEIGWIGEINPEILEELDTLIPMAGFEINLSKLFKYIKNAI